METKTGTSISTMIDSYDPVGNRKSRTRDGVPTTWSYDPGSRLTGQSTVSGTATYVYDSVGNVLTNWNQGQFPKTTSYDVANRMVTLIQGTAVTTFQYDRAGNLTNENASGVLTTYVYDGENRKTIASAPSGISSYTYQGDGLRRSKQEPGTALTTFVWDGSDYLQERI